jgi:hypothetical protein
MASVLFALFEMGHSSDGFQTRTKKINQANNFVSRRKQRAEQLTTSPSYGLTPRLNAEHRILLVKISCVLLPIAFTSIFLIFGNPVKLVFWGAVAQGLILPFLAGAALYFHFTSRHKELSARPFSLMCLGIAALLMTALGVYQIAQALS